VTGAIDLKEGPEKIDIHLLSENSFIKTNHFTLPGGWQAWSRGSGDYF
jgi:hypothetical protein